jgi:hypothetical protein
MAHTTSIYAFGDPSGVMGRLAHDLGNAYLETGLRIHNNSALFRILQDPPPLIAMLNGLTESALQKTLVFINQVISALPEAQLNCPDANLIRDEFRWAADMLQSQFWCNKGQPG